VHHADLGGIERGWAKVGPYLHEWIEVSMRCQLVEKPLQLTAVLGQLRVGDDCSPNVFGEALLVPQGRQNRIISYPNAPSACP
jgi:hypothetical protein